MMLTEETPVPSLALPVAEMKDHLRMGSGFADDGLQDGLIAGVLASGRAAPRPWLVHTAGAMGANAGSQSRTPTHVSASSHSPGSSTPSSAGVLPAHACSTRGGEGWLAASAAAVAAAAARSSNMLLKLAAEGEAEVRRGAAGGASFRGPVRQCQSGHPAGSAKNRQWG